MSGLAPALLAALATALATALAALLGGLGACGGRSNGTGPAARAQVSAVAPGAGGDDVVVAQVNGRPVWGSCVAAQAARGGEAARRTALDECIAFELMAQAAEARGLAAHPEVIDATRTAMVSELVAVFEDTHATPADLGEALTRIVDANAWRMNRPELRASTYARVEVPAGAGAEVEARAKATIERLAAALADETGLLAAHVVEAARRVAAETGVAIVTESVILKHARGLEPSYAGALFGIPEVGRASAPVRTPWGWDVVAFTEVLPARVQTRDQLAAEVFPELRRKAFLQWVNQVVRDRGVQIAVDEAQLEEVGP